MLAIAFSHLLSPSLAFSRSWFMLAIVTHALRGMHPVIAAVVTLIIDALIIVAIVAIVANTIISIIVLP